MSDEYQQNQQVEAKSSVKIATNAKGEAQVEVKAYSGDDDPAALAALSKTATDTYLATRDALVGKVVLA